MPSLSVSAIPIDATTFLVNDRYRVDAHSLDAMRRSGMPEDLMVVACLEEHYRRLLMSAPTADARNELYGIAYGELSELHHARGQLKHGLNDDVVTVVAPLFAGRRVLELGCGTGLLAQQLGASTSEYVGVDASSEAIAVARHIAQTDSVRFITGNVAALDLKPGSFDVVYSNDLLEHLHPADLPELLRRCHALLAPGGRFIAVTSARHFGPFDVSRNYVPRGEAARCFHLSETSYAEIDVLLREIGFRDVRSPLIPFRVYVRLLRIPLIGRRLTAALLRSTHIKARIERNPRLRNALSRLTLLRTVFVIARA